MRMELIFLISASFDDKFINSISYKVIVLTIFMKKMHIRPTIEVLLWEFEMLLTF